MPLVTVALNDALDGAFDAAAYASLHTADPGSTGASEVSGGSYTRQALTWSDAAAGAKATTAAVTFQVPASTTITHFGLWTAASGGTFRGGAALPGGSEAFVLAAPYLLTVAAAANPNDLAGVPETRTITAGTGLSGGGALSADLTLDVDYGTTAGTAAQGDDSRITGPASSYIYATAYGWEADGSQASAAANDAAIAAAVDEALSSGRNIWIPGGNAYISVPIEKDHLVTIEGPGPLQCIISLADNSNCHMVINHVSTNGTTDRNAMYCGIRGIALNGRGASQGGAGPYHGVYYTTDPQTSQASGDQYYDATHLIDNVVVRNVKGDGIHIEGRSDVRISRCKVSNAGRYGISVRYDTHISDCIVEKSGQSGFYAWGSSNQFTNCKAYITGQDVSSLNGMAAVPDDAHGFEVVGSGIGEISFAACDAQEVSGHGFYLHGNCNAIAIGGCTVQKPSFGNGTDYVSFALDNAHNCTITGTSKHETGVQGLALTGGSDRNTIILGHTPIPSNTVTELLTSGSALLANRVIANGAPLHTETDWAATTAYIKGQVIRGPLGARFQVSAAHTSGATFATTNLSMVEGPWPGQAVPSGAYIQVGTTGTSTSAIAAGSLRAYAWYLPHAATLTRIFAEVTTIGDVGSKVRLGIYADTGLLQPGALVLDAGTINGDSATVQEITISQALARGLYWVAAVSQDVTTTTPTVRTVTPAIPINTSALPGAGESTGGWAHGSTIATGALPATFTPSGKTSVVARIGVKG